jgi:hypothetical protein
MTFINRWLRARYGHHWLVGRRAAFGADLPASAAFWRNSKTLRLIFGVLTIVPFLGHAGASGLALHR